MRSVDTPKVVVVGLGPAGAELLTTAVGDAIAAHGADQRWARTDRHPGIDALGQHRSFDAVYEDAEDLESVYDAIVAALVASAQAHGSVLYAVPGSPFVAERTVELLRRRVEIYGDIELVVHPGMSFLDLTWARLGIDPFARGVRLIDGHRFAIEAAGQVGPLLVGQCDSRDVLSDIKLAVEAGPDTPVTVLQRLGLADESVRTVAWADLDREVEPDHLTSLWIPALGAPVAAELMALAEVVRTLRERCPWDSVQTHQSLRPYLVEEAYEVLDAIDQLFEPDAANADPDAAGGSVGDGVDELEEELGDLLFQVVIHATLAAEQGWFNLADVARAIHDKLVRRHPHVFAAQAVEGVAEVVANWDAIKAAEKGRTGVYEGIPAAFPARLYAEKVLRRAAKANLNVDLSAELAALDRAEAALRSAAETVVAADPAKAPDPA